MKYIVIFFFYFSISYGQEVEVLNMVYQQESRISHVGINMPKNTALQTIDDCDKRINENPQDWQAYYSRARSKQILNDFKASIVDTDVLIENGQLLKLAYWIQGESQVNLMEFENAIESYKEAIKYYDSPYTIARINFFIGMCYIKIEKEQEACLYFEKMGNFKSHNGFKLLKNYCLK